MGLLEKGQEKKEHPIITEEPPVIKRKKKQPSRQTRKEMENQAIIEAYRIFTPEKISERPRSLLEKAQQKKDSGVAEFFGQTLELIPPEQPPTEVPTNKAPEEDDASLVIKDTSEQNIEVIDEQTGFGWKEQGKKQIVYDHNSHEFLYKVIEPQLNEEQKKTKDEIAHLFKMMADIDTVDMSFDEKEKFLEETVERIISDNRIYLEEESKDIIYYHIFRDFLGYGRIDILMHDDGIEDISADGPSTPIFIHHRKYEAIETNIFFDSEHELNSFLVRLCQISGKQISIF